MPAHPANKTVDLLLTETSAFIPPTLWLPPDLNLVDYKVWSVLQEHVYKVKVNNVDKLHQHIQTVWEQLDQRIIDKVIKQWRTCLKTCIGHLGQRWNDRVHECFFTFGKNLSGINDFTLTYL